MEYLRWPFSQCHDANGTFASSHSPFSDFSKLHSKFKAWICNKFWYFKIFKIRAYVILQAIWSTVDAAAITGRNFPDTNFIEKYDPVYTGPLIQWAPWKGLRLFVICFLLTRCFSLIGTHSGPPNITMFVAHVIRRVNGVTRLSKVARLRKWPCEKLRISQNFCFKAFI